MIGNTIEFLYYDWKSEFDRDKTREERLTIGIVVDAFTDITGTVSGKSESLFGFGSGSVNGSTKSKRTYKVQYQREYLTNPSYIDIQDWQLIKIISFANSERQEINEEKIKVININPE